MNWGYPPPPTCAQCLVFLPFFLWYRNRCRKKLVPERSLGTGIGKLWFRKKVSEPVSDKFGTGKKVSEPELEKFGTEKSLGTGIKKNWYQKSLGIGLGNFLAPK